MHMSLRWNHSTAFRPTFASVLKSQKSHPNVSDLTFPSVIYWNHTSIVGILTQGNFCNRLLAWISVLYIDGTVAYPGGPCLKPCPPPKLLVNVFFSN